MDNGTNDFNRSLRDVLHPSFRDGTDRTADSFQRLAYGGYLLRQGLSQSVPTRIRFNRTRERQLLFDISHPDAFKTSGKFHISVLDEADFLLNPAAFAENGDAKGNFYNTYRIARVTLSDGRVYVFGGHDLQSDNGLFKVNIFDPETEEWVRRSESWMVCTMNGEENFGAEAIAGGAKFFGPWRGKTWCLDVLAAMKDPKRDVPAQNHWKALDEADEVRRPAARPPA
jgi:hypothetical protein